MGQTTLGTGKHKVHISYIWATAIAPVITLAAIFAFSVLPGVFAAGVIDGELLEQWPIILALIVVCPLAIFALIIGLLFLGYKNLSFEFTSSEFNLYSGIFIKKRVHVPYQRVQSVNHNASLIQRIIGVCSVSIETAGGASNKAVHVPYVRTVVAEQIRVELFSRKEAALQGVVAEPVAGVQAVGYLPNDTASNALDQSLGEFATERGVFGGAALDTGAISYECRLTTKELILSAISNRSSGVAVIIGALVTIFGFVGFDVTNLFVNMMFEELFGLDDSSGLEIVGGFASSAIHTVALPVIALVIFIIIFIWALGVLTTCISFGGFSARRRQNRIEVERGLIQHQFSGIDIERVQSVIIRQGFIRRCIGYCELALGRVDSLDKDNDKSQQNNLLYKGLVIHPFVKLSAVPQILSGLVPEYAALPTQAIKPPPVASRRALIRRCVWHNGMFWTGLCVAIAQYVLQNFVNARIITSGDGFDTAVFLTIVNTAAIVVYAIFVISLVLGIVDAILWYLSSSFAYNNAFMTIKNGGLTTEAVSFPRKKIQFGYIKTNPFQRLAKVASINVVTAAGIGGTNTQLWDVTNPDAKTWLTWLQPGGNK